MQWTIVLFVVVVGSSVVDVVWMGLSVAVSDGWATSVWSVLFGSTLVKLVTTSGISNSPASRARPEPSSGSPALWGSGQGSGSLALIVS